MTVHVQQLLNFQTFYSKTDFSIHQIFPLLSKIWYSKWPLWNFFEFWILNDCSCTTTFEPWTFKLSNLNCWLRFLGFISLRSKWQRNYLCLENRKEKQESGNRTINFEFWILNDCSCTTTFELLNLKLLNFELIWFLHFAALQSKWQRNYLCLEYRKEKRDARVRKQDY